LREQGIHFGIPKRRAFYHQSPISLNFVIKYLTETSLPAHIQSLTLAMEIIVGFTIFAVRRWILPEILAF